jgi:phosphatidate cytidylyltransferase
MNNNIFVLVINFLIGAIGLFVFIRNKKIDSASMLTRKYFSYLLIVSCILACIRFSGIYLPIIFSIIVIAGAYEIIKISKKNNTVLILSLLIFITEGCFFVNFGFAKWEVIAWVYTLVVTFDGYCQICGQMFGKNLLLAKISPRKTWEGFIGGIILTFISSFFLQKVLPHYYLMVLLVVVSSLTGDLLASSLKRRVCVKDFSNLIPGHGGIMDRFDSFIFCGCLFGLINIIYAIQ